jgi:hypothetical protein
MKTNILKIALHSALSLTILMPAFAQAENFTVNGKTYRVPVSAQENVKFALENMKSRTDVVNLMKLSRLSDESVKAIEKDLKRRTTDKEVLPAMTVKKDEIYLNDKATGIVISSYSPLKVKYQGRTWSASHNKTADDNYMSFVKFIEKPRSFSLAPLLMPEAQAFFGFGSMGSGALSGLAIGALGGGLMSWFTGGSMWNGALWGGLIGGAAGGIFGMLNNDRKSTGSSGFF